MNPSPTVNILTDGLTLTRYHCGPSPDELGTAEFWKQSIDQLRARMPFSDLFNRLKIHVWNMDHAELDAKVEKKEWCLEDYDPNAPGYQVADGLTAGTEIHLGVFPDGYTTGGYTGPLRPLSEGARARARKALSHEFGHYMQGQCRYDGVDEIAKWIKLRFNEFRPHQAAGDNPYEDWAECYRAILGADECRGYFSDNKPFTPSPELKSLMTCAYWLQGNLAGLKVHDFTPQTYGVVYQVLFGVNWKWRFIGLDWRSQEWINGRWTLI